MRSTRLHAPVMISSLELAKLCGVSQGTVDRALHGRTGISDQTRKRVLSAARKHGYRPHPAVRELLGGESRSVAGIVPAINSPFFLDLFHQIRQALAGEGLRLLLTAVEDRAGFLEAIEEFASRRMRAALVVPPVDDLLIPADLTRRMAVVSFLSPCRGQRVWFLSPDEEQTGRDAVDYLASRGHRRISHLTYTRQAWGIRARAAGYRQRMERLGLAVSELAPVDEAGLLRLIERTRPTALFCHNDWLALSAIRILESNGIRVPGDVSVLGVDDSPTFTELCPDVTTMHYPFAQLAQRTLQIVRGTAGGDLSIEKLTVVERRTVRSV